MFTISSSAIILKKELSWDRMVNLREIILESLMEILEKGQYSHLVEKAVLDKVDFLDKSDKSYIKRMTEGTVEKVIVLDNILNRFLKTPISKLKPLLRTILRMGTYEILFMDKTPGYAAVNDAVNLTKKHGFKNMAPLVNAVLRNVERNADSLKVETICPIPEWMQKHFVSGYGEDKAKEIIDGISGEHPVTLRRRNQEADVSKLIKHPGSDEAFMLPKGMSLSEVEGFERGDFTVQDLSSMTVCRMAGIIPGVKVLDVCAAPGGKAIHAHDLGAEVTARDVSEYKVSLIEDNIRRLGIKGLKTEVFDATVKDERSENSVDILIADVPCSGLGVVSKKSDILTKLKESDLANIVSLQKRIVDTVFSYVKPGGILMYSTCTLNPDENERMAEYIASEHNYEMLEEKTFFPNNEGNDGFYIAKLKRKND